MKDTKTIAEMWDYLVDNGIATREELELITNINGYNEEAMCDVLYARTGENSFDDEEEEE